MYLYLISVCPSTLRRVASLRDIWILWWVWIPIFGLIMTSFDTTWCKWCAFQSDVKKTHSRTHDVLTINVEQKIIENLYTSSMEKQRGLWCTWTTHLGASWPKTVRISTINFRSTRVYTSSRTDLRDAGQLLRCGIRWPQSRYGSPLFILSSITASSGERCSDLYLITSISGSRLSQTV